MKELENIKRLETPNYLLTRIEGKLEEMKPLVSFRLVALYAAVLGCFIFLQAESNFSYNHKTTTEYYVQELGMTIDYKLYNE